MEYRKEIVYPTFLVKIKMQRYFFLYALQSELQWEHNSNGAKWRKAKQDLENGTITQEEFDIKDSNWKRYLQEYFNPTVEAISEEISSLRQSAFERIDYKPDLSKHVRDKV